MLIEVDETCPAYVNTTQRYLSVVILCIDKQSKKVVLSHAECNKASRDSSSLSSPILFSFVCRTPCKLSVHFVEDFTLHKLTVVFSIVQARGRTFGLDA